MSSACMTCGGLSGNLLVTQEDIGTALYHDSGCNLGCVCSQSTSLGALCLDLTVGKAADYTRQGTRKASLNQYRTACPTGCMLIAQLALWNQIPNPQSLRCVAAVSGTALPCCGACNRATKAALFVCGILGPILACEPPLGSKSGFKLAQREMVRRNSTSYLAPGRKHQVIRWVPLERSSTHMYIYAGTVPVLSFRLLRFFS